MRDDAFAQRNSTERLGIAEWIARPQGRLRRFHRTGGSASTRLTDLHTDHMRRTGRQCRLARIGRGNDVHDDEWGSRRATANFQCHVRLS
jgi:hypothetical protein